MKKTRSSRDRVASSSFASNPLPPWAGRVLLLAVAGGALALVGATILSGGGNDFDKEREAVFLTAEQQLAELESGKGAASPDDPKLRKVAASIAADRPSNPLMAAKHWINSKVSKPDPCDENNLRKDLLRERIAMVELESMTRSPIQRKDAEAVLERLDGNFESHRYTVFIDRCGLPAERWIPRITSARLEERALAVRGRIAQEFGPGFESQLRSSKQRRSKS